MPNSGVLAELAALEASSTDDLKLRWQAAFGAPAPRYSRRFLLERLAYRLQEFPAGGLSTDLKANLDQLLDVAGYDEWGVQRRLKSPRSKHKKTRALAGESASLLPGTRMVRHWCGQTYEVEVLARGYRFQGRHYRSLSAIANEITGSHRNGRAFFGLGLKKAS